ncbi:MAG TPA: class I SAM-dependent methyltransferase [Burkholderiaceae bacterium]|nr:class I SAM-dependent methyltransferase [Burkholderiaceae bacterium]
MEKSSRTDIPLTTQRAMWERWNREANRRRHLAPSPARQAEAVDQFIRSLSRTDLAILDVGCGTGWLCERLMRYGDVTGTDIVDSALQQAKLHIPNVRFLCGDFVHIDFVPSSFDVIVSLEVVAHVADQITFIDRIVELLKPGGHLLLSTQNRPVLERWSEVGPPANGQLRSWLNARELRMLLMPRFDDVHITSLVPVGDRGILRLVNSHKLNTLLGYVVPNHVIERAKESVMLGHTLFATAQKKLNS